MCCAVRPACILPTVWWSDWCPQNPDTIPSCISKLYRNCSFNLHIHVHVSSSKDKAKTDRQTHRDTDRQTHRHTEILNIKTKSTLKMGRSFITATCTCTCLCHPHAAIFRAVYCMCLSCRFWSELCIPLFWLLAHSYQVGVASSTAEACTLRQSPARRQLVKSLPPKSP